MYCQLNDSEIIPLLNKQDPTAFEFVYNLYSGQMFLHAHRMLGKEDLAKDLVQDVFEKLLTQRGQIDPSVKLRYWLHACLRNRVLNHIRNEKIRSEHLYNLCKFSLDQESETDSQLWKKEITWHIDAAVSKLPTEIRKTFELSWNQSMKAPEIAQTTHKSINTIRKQMQRALKLLKSQLSHDLLITAIIIYRILC